MAISQAMVTSFKVEILDGIHNFGVGVVRASTAADVFKLALYTSSATLSAATTAYTTSDEVSSSGTNYTAGGKTLTISQAPTFTSTTAWLDFDDVTWDSATITPEAASVLNSAVTAYDNCANVPIMLAGYTDTSGPKPYNLRLAAQRNDSVRTYLTGRGVPAARITSEAFGEANLRVPTADGVRELQNRRVEITYGPGSGR